jgi:hypothetical protein
MEYMLDKASAYELPLMFEGQEMRFNDTARLFRRIFYGIIQSNSTKTIDEASIWPIDGDVTNKDINKKALLKAAKEAFNNECNDRRG